MKKIVILFLLTGGALACFATIRLPAILSSHMVLQQRSDARLWGWCDPGESVVVTTSWDQRTDSVKGTRDGQWEIKIPTPAAGGPYTIELKGWNTIVLDNVLIGEVWICSGQSNMEMCESWGLPDVTRELPVSYNENLHFFHIPRTTALNPQDDCDGRWAVCDSISLKSFSAVGYFFGRKLNRDLHIPIGIIEAAWGGTPAEVWTPKEFIDADSTLATAAPLIKPADGWPYLPGYCYNGMIAPIRRFEIAGAIWYQGEGNMSNASTYSHLFTTMIESWRKAWGKTLPFYFVQIAPYTYRPDEAGTTVREQQARSQSLPQTGMVVISDITGDTTNIHPKDKRSVGDRLANWALAETYQRPGIIYKNPAYQKMTAKQDKLELQLDNAPTGLMMKGTAIREMMIAGDDHVFYPADAKIEGDRLIVSSKKVKKPVAARYQFTSAGIGNIFSKEGLPVAPFRTDDW